MRQICCLYEVSLSNRMLEKPPLLLRHIDSKLKEDDVLFLANIFLTPGLHQISVQNVTSGRKILYETLQSMHYYHEIACLTCAYEPPLKKSINNIFFALCSQCGTNASYEEIEAFVLDNCFADFLWVELTESFLELPLIKYAIRAMHDLDIVHNIPIVALSYNGYS